MSDTPVPADAWQVGPWNRWSFQHVDEVVAVQGVARDPGRVHPWPSAAAAALDDLVDPLVADAWADGVLVARRGTIACERYANGMTSDTLHLSQSVAKSVLGLLVGILAEHGVLTRDELATTYVPEAQAGGYRAATVGHLLDMTAGVDFVEDYANFVRYDAACGWHPLAPGDPETIIAYLPTIGAASWAHGERFHYVSPNTDLLGLVVERAAGRRLSELIAEHLWGPLGAERDALMTVDRGGTAVVSGGLCACLRDYARIGQLVADGGAGIVPAAWVDSLGDGSRAAWSAAGVDSPYRPGTTGYANQWWCLDGRPTARGIHGQLVTVHRASATVITVLSSAPDALDPRLDRIHRDFANAVLDRLADTGRAAPR
jgi:CubicO group peptidase (beta-lactamase class C family)